MNDDNTKRPPTPEEVGKKITEAIRAAFEDSEVNIVSIGPIGELPEQVKELLGEKPAVETQIEVAEDGEISTSFSINDPSGIRKILNLDIAWVPAVQGSPDKPETNVDLSTIPVMIMTTEPVHNHGDADPTTVVYLLTSDETSAMIGKAVDMFVKDYDRTNEIMEVVGAMIEAS